MTVLNAALLEDPNDVRFLTDALVPFMADAGHTLSVSDNPWFHQRTKLAQRLTCVEIGLDNDQIEADLVLNLLGKALGPETEGALVLVDMSWVTRMVQAPHIIRAWGRISERLVKDLGILLVTRYDRELLVEEQARSAFAAHPQFVSPSGVFDNPHWMPVDVQRAPWGEQMSFLLGRVVPDYVGKRFFEREDRFAARGADPDWLNTSLDYSVVGLKDDVWQIYCFGQLRVYKNQSERIDWKLKGGAPRKTRTLFAYLLTHGEKGAHVDRIAELLWPEEPDADVKRARLHHTVAMLRKTLGDKDAVLRGGDFYRLNAPEGSWIDITSFEQLCRRGVSLFRRGQLDDALQIYQTAEQLYAGDLFQDVPAVYVDDEQEDWCMPRRIWLREMALKLQRDMSALLREKGRLREALEHCQKALTIDPTSDDANIEAMRVFHAQGRPDTVLRQYRQYRKAMEMIDATAEGSEVQAAFLALTQR